MFDGKFRAPVDKAVRPIGSALRKTGLTPDQLTIMGLVVAVGAAVAVGAGRLHLGLALVILAALPDLLDGALAKASGNASQRGAFFDSTVDRITDSLLLGGIAWYYAAGERPLLVMLPYSVSALSMMISYQRAKAESLNLGAKGGLMERAERIVALCIGLFLEPWVPGALTVILWIMLVLIAITAAQRFVKIWRQADAPPAAQARIEFRRARRQERKATRAKRRRTRVPLRERLSRNE